MPQCNILHNHRWIGLQRDTVCIGLLTTDLHMQISGVYASEWVSPSVGVRYPLCKICKSSMCSLVKWADTAFWLCTAVVRELLYNMYNEATRYHVVAEGQSADVIINRTIPRRWPSIETTQINVTCLLVYRAYILKCPEMWQPRFCVLIGQGCLSRPMICLRCRSAYLRMFFTTIVAMMSEAYKPRARFSKAIYIIAKYFIDIMIDLVSRAKHLLAFPSFKLSLWWFLKIILA